MSNNSGLPRELRSELIYAAAAANAWLRGLSLPCVALHYRYEPLTALNLIARLSDQYGTKNVEHWVPAHVLTCALTSGRTAASLKSWLIYRRVEALRAQQNL